MDGGKNIDKETNFSFKTLKSVFTNMTSKAKIKFFLIIAVIVVFVIVINSFDSKEEIATSTMVDSSFKSNDGYYVSSLNYCSALENKLEMVLSNMGGLGKVEVMVSLESSLELVLASSIQEKMGASQSGVADFNTIEVSSPIIIESNGVEKPLVIKEILPKVKGVLIVCSQMQNQIKKIEIVQAVQSLLGIAVSNIQVLSNSK